MSQPPDILWILTTQWRAQALGCVGDPNVRTPHLDAFARQAANFVQAVTPHPFGPFARAALFTGVPSPANGVADYFDPLPLDSRTIAQAVRDCGYTTAFFGKWHLGARDPKAPLVGEAHARTIIPEEARGGFELWEGFESGFLLNDPWLHGTRLPEPRRFSGYQADVLCSRAAEWMGEPRTLSGKPRFCVLSLEAPHPPYDAPAAGVPAKDPCMLALAPNVPRGGEPERKARRELAGYYAHIEATDRAIGALLAAFRDRDLVVVFTSVHGDMHGAHGLFRKGWPHEECVRVPLLVGLPRTRACAGWGGSRMELVSLIDVHRWTREWASGRDAGIETAAAQQISMPSVVHFQHQCDRAWRGVRTRMRKLVVADSLDRGNKPESTPWLYFDLENDPFEQTNLAEDPAHQLEMSALETLIKLPPPGV